MFRKILLLPFIVAVLILTGCETTNKSALDAAIAEMKATLEAKDAEQDAAVASASKTAQRAEAMTEQNRSALRALNDKIDRMFKTISRK